MARDTWKAVLPLAVVMTFGVTAARAEVLQALAGTVGQTPVFNSSTGEWEVIGANLSGAMAFSDSYYYTLGNFSTYASFTWTGNFLTNDLSAGGHARGVFSGGGTLSISGTMYDLNTEQPVYTGLLLTGEVSPFEAYEPLEGDNFLDLEYTSHFTPLAGALVDGSWGLEMYGSYIMSFTGGVAQTLSGNLVNFQEDIYSLATLDWNIFPEPASLLLLALGGGLVARRPQK